MSFGRSVQNDIKKPRVHITYDTQLSGSPEKREIPFNMGVLAPLSGNAGGNPDEEPRFIDIDKDNFDQVMKAIKPAVAVRVKNQLRPGDSNLPVELKFGSMDDFLPHKIAEQVPELLELLKKRAELNNLKMRAASSRKMADLLDAVVRETRRVRDSARQQTPAELTE